MVRVCIDPGHGGNDPGALGQPGPLNEKDVVLQVAERLHRALRARGHSVFFTRDADYAVDIYPRSVLANDAGAELFISIHCNASSGSGQGIEAYYAPSKGAPDYGLARAVYNAAVQAFSDHRARGVKEDTTTRHERLGVLRDTKAPAVLIELEFIDTPAQYAFLTDPVQQERYAAALADGLEAATVAEPPALPVSSAPPSATAVPVRPSVIGRQTERNLRWDYRAAGATHYRTRYAEDGATPSMWSEFTTDLSFALTAGPNTQKVLFEVQPQNVNGTGPIGEDEQTLVSPAPPPTITHSIAYREAGPVVLFGLTATAAADYRYRTRLDPLAPWSAWSAWSATTATPYADGARGKTIYFEAQARSAGGLVSDASAVAVEIPLRPQSAPALGGTPRVFYNGTELPGVQRVVSSEGIGVYADAVQVVLLGRSVPPDADRAGGDIRVVWPDGGEASWPLHSYGSNVDPPALRLSGRRRAHAAELGKQVRRRLAEAQFDSAVLAGSTRHSAAVSQYTHASGRTLADDLQQALADQHADLDIARLLTRYGFLVLDQLGNIASMEATSEAYTLPVTYEPGLVIAWQAAAETHPRHMGTKQITATYTPTTPTGQALSIEPATLTVGGGLPAIRIEGQWRNDAHAALHIAFERIRLVYNSGTLRTTIAGTTGPEPRQRLVDLPATAAADWPYWALRQVEQQWDRETGWQTVLTAYPVPDGPREP